MHQHEGVEPIGKEFLGHRKTISHAFPPCERSN